MDNKWIFHWQHQPTQGQKVIYWHEILGMWIGTYMGNDVYSGVGGFHTDTEDTWWMAAPEEPFRKQESYE